MVRKFNKDIAYGFQYKDGTFMLYTEKDVKYWFEHTYQIQFHGNIIAKFKISVH